MAEYNVPTRKPDTPNLDATLLRAAKHHGERVHDLIATDRATLLRPIPLELLALDTLSDVERTFLMAQVGVIVYSGGAIPGDQLAYHADPHALDDEWKHASETGQIARIVRAEGQ